MGVIDLHEKPFDETTIAKLEIFEEYAQAWIPTFVMSGYEEIHIFDFFAGTGYDKEGRSGSPIRILEKIKDHIDNIQFKRIKIHVHLNEFKTKKYELLRQACNDFLENNPTVKYATRIKLYNQSFNEVFNKLLPRIKKFPSLVYLDQNGVKFIAEEYIFKLEKCSTTDFLYFVSSSYFWRFGDQDAFKKHFNIDIEKAKENPYKFIHKHILEELKSTLPANTQLKLYPFTLQKGTNIHGIIFGASFPLAVDKFLKIAWKMNSINGEANFDIFDDSPSSQLEFNFEDKKLSKIENFKLSLEENILSGKLKNNREVYDFTLDCGHVPSHAIELLRKLKKEKKIYFSTKSPLITYDNVYKNKRILNYDLCN